MKLLVAGATYGVPSTVPITEDTPQRPINPNGRSTCIRDYIHVYELADSHVLGLQHLLAGCGQHIYNVGNSTGYSVQQVLDVARWVTGRGLLAHVAQRRSGDPPALVASAEKAQLDLGWRAPYPALETIIEHAWNWHQPISGVQSG